MELNDLQFNGAVQLLSDTAFRGYIVGRCTPDHIVLGVIILVAVVEPGKTGLRGNVRLPLSDLAKAPAGRSR